MKTHLARRLISLALALCLCIGLIPCVSMQVNAASLSESEFANRIAQLKTVYRDKEYWNGYNTVGYDGTGSKKCYCTYGCAANCSCDCGKFYLNGVKYGGQCFGFANKMAYLIFGSVPDIGTRASHGDWIYYSGSNNSTFYAGDYVRVRNDAHSIFITAVNGDTITYVDCNNYGPCQVKWDRTISKSELLSKTTYVYRLSGNSLSGTTACSCSSSYAGTYICATSSAPLTIRSGHGTSYSVVGSIPSGATVTVTKASSTWAHVTYNGVSGYASMEYLQKKDGTTNEVIIYNFLRKEMGLNTAAACGVLANIEKESNFRNDVIEFGYTWESGGGYGICQWTNSPRTSNSGRRTNLVNWCNNNGLDYRSLTGQLQYLKYELNTSYYYTYVMSKLLAVDNTAQGAYDAAYYWCYYFEVPAGYNTGVSETRGNIAKNTYWPRYQQFESSSHSPHTYAGSYYEAAHPHKIYQQCLYCTATQHTGEEKYVSTCGTCNPVNSTSTYNAVLPFTAHLKSESTVYVYTSEHLAEKSGGEIWSTDECTIKAVYSNGACLVKYPVDSSYKEAYVSLSEFIGDTSSNLAKMTVNKQIDTYIRASTSSTKYGYTELGDVIYLVGINGNMTQIFYPGSSGYKLAWIRTDDLFEPTYDDRFGPYCPIKGYPCAASDFDVYAKDYSTVTGEIWTTDYCTINAVYEDGWCNVSYPADGTTKTAYTRLSNFVYNISASHTKYTATAQTTTYTNQSLSTNNGWLSAGDVFYVVGAYGSASQVLYPIDAQYGGGCKLGWIKTSDLPKTTYTISYNANGGTGAPAPQTKTHGVALKLSTKIPEKNGYAFAGWATTSTASAAEYADGAAYTKDANVTLYAVWKLTKYEITYDSNGGINAPAAQNKAHGTNLALSTSVPTKAYTITFDPNGGTVDVAKRQGSCEFLGWATSSTATSAAYQPGGTFTTNANTTLYAVWKNPTLALYSIPARTGYVFDGWYTDASGGTQITSSTTISSDMTVYAHWIVATYSVNYDANGGTGEPASQTKTHGTDLTLSEVIPTKTNHTFLGWATEENPSQVQYQPGDTYSANAGIVLIAVWSCDLNPTITVGSVSGKPGDTVTVAVRIAENPGIIVARLKISYDSSALTLTRVIDGGILGEYNFGENLSSNPYIVTWSNGTAQADYTANGDLVYLTFKIADNARAGSLPITIRYDEEEIFNKALENIAFATTAGTITVEENEEIDPNAPQIIVNGTKGRAGTTVSVAISLNNNPGIASMRLKVDYDSSVLSLVGVNDLGELGSQLHSDQHTDPYVLCWANDTVTQNFTHNGDIVVLTFKINDDAAIGTYDISISYDYDKYDIHNVQVQKVKFYTVDGAIEVVDVLPGDANGDGSVDTLDRLTLSRYLANWKGYTLDQLNFAGADVNSDGSVDTLDRLILSRHLANWSGYEDTTSST